MKCPVCKKIIIDINSEGVIRLRTRLILAKEHSLLVRCPNCKNMVEVPIEIDKQLKALATH